MVFLTLIACIAPLVLAIQVPSDLTTSMHHLSDIERMLNIENRTKSFEGPPLNSSAITRKIIADGEGKLSRRFTITLEDCLDPSDRPDIENCSDLCTYLSGSQGPLVIPPLDVWVAEVGVCAFGVANLDPCAEIYVDPISILGAYCQSMYANCVIYGYDGWIQGTNPEMAMTLSGIAAAPPYSEQPCV